MCEASVGDLDVQVGVVVVARGVCFQDRRGAFDCVVMSWSAHGRVPRVRVVERSQLAVGGFPIVKRRKVILRSLSVRVS